LNLLRDLSSLKILIKVGIQSSYIPVLGIGTKFIKAGGKVDEV
jgi:hypothetical protein